MVMNSLLQHNKNRELKETDLEGSTVWFWACVYLCNVYSQSIFTASNSIATSQK